VLWLRLRDRRGGRREGVGKRGGGTRISSGHPVLVAVLFLRIRRRKRSGMVEISTCLNFAPVRPSRPGRHSGPGSKAPSRLGQYFSHPPSSQSFFLLFPPPPAIGGARDLLDSRFHQKSTAVHRHRQSRVFPNPTTIPSLSAMSELERTKSASEVSMKDVDDEVDEYEEVKSVRSR
jgi:hypothetical protein